MLKKWIFFLKKKYEQKEFTEKLNRDFMKNPYLEIKKNKKRIINVYLKSKNCVKIFKNETSILLKNVTFGSILIVLGSGALFIENWYKYIFLIPNVAYIAYIAYIVLNKNRYLVLNLS